jgi:hypothetical protein
MPPRALTPITRTVNVAPQRAASPARTALVPRQAQVLQTGRAPAQLSLFGRPSGAR